LRKYEGDRTALGRAEQFMLAVLAVPRFARKLRAVRFKFFFSTQAAELRASLDLVVQTSMQLRGSELLKKMMQVRAHKRGASLARGCG
jgi:hypothetical protein